jgi:exonuclease VII large subunit
LRGAARGQVDTHALHLEGRGSRLARSSVRVLQSGRAVLRSQTQRLVVSPARQMQVEDLRVAQWRRLLGAYDYRRQLERGYSVTRGGDGRVLRSVAGLTAGSRLLTRLVDGDVESVVSTVGGGSFEGSRGTGVQADPNDDEGKQ